MTGRCLLSVVDAYRLKSEHSSAYLGISGRSGITWWLAHTISSILDPRDVHQPWSHITLRAKYRIRCVSNAYRTCITQYSLNTSKYTLIHNKYASYSTSLEFSSKIRHNTVKYALDTRILWNTAQIHANTPQIRVNTRIERKPPQF